MKARGEIRDYDSAGTLTAAGFEWTMRSAGQFLLLIPVVLFGACGAAAIAMAMEPNLQTLPHLLIAVFFLTLAWLTYQFRKRRNRPKGAIIFHADGKMTCPHGYPGYASARSFNVPWSEVSSIAAERESVSIYFRDGDVVTATYLPADATLHKVSVQLQLALTAIRDAVAQRAAPGRVASSPDLPIRID
jgi:hypothetical protein